MKSLLKRIVYLGYYFRQMDWPLLAKFMGHVQAQMGWGKGRQWREIFRDSLRFNISPLEYYQFRFFELTDAEKATWAGTGTMYEFQKSANPSANRHILLDKRQFYHAYRRFFRHELVSLQELQADIGRLEDLLTSNKKLVFKEATGNCGAGVAVRNVQGMTAVTALELMETEGFDIVETFVKQHPALNALSPSAVNTVRIFTQTRKNGEYEILGCRQRISVDSPVDNLAAGNLAAPINANSGIIEGPGVYSDMTREPEELHPITGVRIVGLQIPFWQETLSLVREASFLHPENRSVGWDVVITPEGPGLIEGNHDWCKLVWQLPVNRGLKDRLDRT